MPSTFHRILLLLTLPLTALAEPLPRSDEADAHRLMDQAQAYFKQHGMARSIAEFNRLDSPFNVKSDINPKGDLYLYSLTRSGYQSVHGKNPKIRGKVMLDMRDADGIFLIRELVKACFESREGRGWVSYKWPHPLTKTVEAKRGYVQRVPGEPDFCLGTGIYVSR
ncbi:cache domain-containing protein [Pelomonas sp. SE-A7]|uniref:cache domain-containing protein n=1 Tax=Pelomonas sp. SE-A7 TaxID=3054953 RepID=UPI00259CD475|nr:cache domain-containing protein [Pelomonas sp. SE-A7]MDM4766099.1 cache domain-containing protein [Pelomonas sp. SE-A7]